MKIVSEHLVIDEIEKYLEANILDDEEGDSFLRVGEHVDSCDECLSKLRFLSGLNSLVDKWNADSHSKFTKAAQVYRALVELSTTVEDSFIKTRLVNWIERFKGCSGAALEFTMNSIDQFTGKVTKILSDSIRSLEIPNSPLSFHYAPSAVGARGEGSSGVALNRAVTSGDSCAEIKIDGRQSRIDIEIPADKYGGNLPLIILLPLGEGEILFSTARYDSVSGNLYAAFKKIQPGNFLILLAPPEG